MNTGDVRHVDRESGRINARSPWAQVLRRHTTYSGETALSCTPFRTHARASQSFLNQQKAERDTLHRDHSPWNSVPSSTMCWCGTLRLAERGTSIPSAVGPRWQIGANCIAQFTPMTPIFLRALAGKIGIWTLKANLQCALCYLFFYFFLLALFSPSWPFYWQSCVSCLFRSSLNFISGDKET